VSKISKKNSLKEYVFVNSALKLQCHIAHFYALVNLGTKVRCCYFYFFRFGVINMKCTYNSLEQMKRLKKENILKLTEFSCFKTKIEFRNLNTNGLKDYLSKNVFHYINDYLKGFHNAACLFLFY